MNENFKTLLGQRIKEARVRAGLTQSALAEKADVSTNHISAIERGISDTKTEHFANIVKALGVSSDLELRRKTKMNNWTELLEWLQGCVRQISFLNILLQV